MADRQAVGDPAARLIAPRFANGKATHTILLRFRVTQSLLVRAAIHLSASYLLCDMIAGGVGVGPRYFHRGIVAA